VAHSPFKAWNDGGKMITKSVLEGMSKVGLGGDGWGGTGAVVGGGQ